jgi:hypothetical protein
MIEIAIQINIPVPEEKFIEVTNSTYLSGAARGDTPLVNGNSNWTYPYISALQNLKPIPLSLSQEPHFDFCRIAFNRSGLNTNLYPLHVVFFHILLKQGKIERNDRNGEIRVRKVFQKQALEELTKLQVSIYLQNFGTVAARLKH